MFQRELFAESLAEVREGTVRYVLRRNPQRAAELEATRADKLLRLEQKVKAGNDYLKAHRRASLQTRIKALSKEVEKLKLQAWVSVTSGETRLLALAIDQQASDEEAKLAQEVKAIPSRAAGKRRAGPRRLDLSLFAIPIGPRVARLKLNPVVVTRTDGTR